MRRRTRTGGCIILIMGLLLAGRRTADKEGGDEGGCWWIPHQGRWNIESSRRIGGAKKRKEDRRGETSNKVARKRVRAVRARRDRCKETIPLQ